MLSYKEFIKCAVYGYEYTKSATLAKKADPARNQMVAQRRAAVQAGTAKPITSPGVAPKAQATAPQAAASETRQEPSQQTYDRDSARQLAYRSVFGADNDDIMDRDEARRLEYRSVFGPTAPISGVQTSGPSGYNDTRDLARRIAYQSVLGPAEEVGQEPAQLTEPAQQPEQKLPWWKKGRPTSARERKPYRR